MKKHQSKSLALPPKPVHPRATRYHGLFGVEFLRQHMIVDNRWTPVDQTQQFRDMTNIIIKHKECLRMEDAAKSKGYLGDTRELKRQCRDGRRKLSNVLHNDDNNKIRSLLLNHKDMQRLYQNMPIESVVDNINQRTFLMRKERDRLYFKVKQLKKAYTAKLVERASLENKIIYEQEALLDEEKKSSSFRKSIDNATVRLNAIKTINSTYRKVIQVLCQDAIFFEPILLSLDKDIEDQASFIKHVLFLGKPAIAHFSDLSEKYRIIDEKSLRNRQTVLQSLSIYRRNTSSLMKHAKSANPMRKVKRYVRDTRSMTFLRNELAAIENMIKDIKYVTLCSKANELYPRIKSQLTNNEKLQKTIQSDLMTYRNDEIKVKRASILGNILVNNLSDPEIARINQIKELHQKIKNEEEKEKNLISTIKIRSDAYVVLRFTLWNLFEILHNVDRPTKPSPVRYPNSYLHLPLLKFEMYTMRAYPPDPPEENIDNMVRIVLRKVQKLMNVYENELTPDEEERCRIRYEDLLMDSFESDLMATSAGSVDNDQELLEQEFDLADTKIPHNVPNRKQIKAISARIVEENAKPE